VALEMQHGQEPVADTQAFSLAYLQQQQGYCIGMLSEWLP
jgi:hypothetical protein